MVTSKTLLGFLSAAAVILAGCKDKPTTSAAVPPDVQVVHPMQRDEPIYAEWVGAVDGSVNAQVRAQVTGLLL
jgi:membrane fusion protein (multidrug efflux system)